MSDGLLEDDSAVSPKIEAGAPLGARVVMLMIRCFTIRRFPAHSLSHLFGGCWTS